MPPAANVAHALISGLIKRGAVEKAVTDRVGFWEDVKVG